MNIRRIATAAAFVFATLLVGLPAHAATQSATQSAAIQPDTTVTVTTGTPADWPWG